MRILYDGAIYQWQQRGGVNRYFANIIGRLPDNFAPVLTTARRRGIEFPSHPRLRILGFERFQPQRLSLKLEQLLFARHLGKERFDLFHPTYYSLLSQKPIERRNTPIVLTFWDIVHDLFPEFDPTGKVLSLKRKAVAAADAIICISENTKRDLLERYSVSAAKVVVIPLAAELDASLADRNSVVPERPFFLYVGPRVGYKNFSSLLHAFKVFAQSERDIVLCLAGPELSAAEEKQIQSMGITSRIVSLGPVSDEHLANLYRNSLALVYPSLYEGFGLPALEAMACGTAVIASNRASLPEVVGEAGLLVNPDSVAELTEAMERVVGDSSGRERMIVMGLARAAEFSWQRTADETVKLYKAVSGHSGSLSAA